MPDLATFQLAFAAAMRAHRPPRRARAPARLRRLSQHQRRSALIDDAARRLSGGRRDCSATQCSAQTALDFVRASSADRSRCCSAMAQASPTSSPTQAWIARTALSCPTSPTIERLRDRGARRRRRARARLRATSPARRRPAGPRCACRSHPATRFGWLQTPALTIWRAHHERRLRDARRPNGAPKARSSPARDGRGPWSSRSTRRRTACCSASGSARAPARPPPRPPPPIPRPTSPRSSPPSSIAAPSPCPPPRKELNMATSSPKPSPRRLAPRTRSLCSRALAEKALPRRPAAARPAARHRRDLLPVRPDQGRGLVHADRQHLLSVRDRLCAAAAAAGPRRLCRDDRRASLPDPARARPVHPLLRGGPARHDAGHRDLRLSRRLADAPELGRAAAAR